MGLFRPLIGCDIQILEVMVKKDRLPHVLTISDLADLLVWVDFHDYWKKAAEEVPDDYFETVGESKAFLNKMAAIYYEKIYQACRAGLLSSEIRKEENALGAVDTT